jgi:hypothetical protein
MSEPFENNHSSPDAVPPQRPTSQPVQPENELRGSEQPVLASPAPPPPARRRRGTRRRSRVPARAAGAYRATDVPPPVQHYDACSGVWPAGAAPAGQPPGCPGPTFYAGQGEALQALYRQDAWLDTLVGAIDACFRGIGPAAVMPLVAALEDADGRARAVAARALRLVGPAARAALSAARRAADDPDALVRWEAGMLLERLKAGPDASKVEQW